MYMMVLYF